MHSRSSVFKGYAIAAAVVLAQACGGNATAPTPATAPQISCPAPLTAMSLDGNPVAVAYTAPTVTGGAPPVTTTCSQPGGSSFPVGTTTISCTASDARRQTTSCSLAVTVVKAPLLNATKVVAFGDSITFGVSGECTRNLAFGRTLTFAEDMQRLLAANALAANKDYPSVLRALLWQRYIGNPPQVINAGRGGESVTDPATLERLRATLNAQAPDVLLLQEGINDLNGIGASAVTVVPESLRAMVRHAQGRGVRVFLATLLPERTGSCRAHGAAHVPATNAFIRNVATQEGAALVDLETAFAGQLDTLLDEDGLHPTEAGYQKMAETFFEALRTTLEIQGMRGTAP